MKKQNWTNKKNRVFYAVIEQVEKTKQKTIIPVDKGTMKVKKKQLN